MEDRLKPCPFCGGDAEVVMTTTTAGYVRCTDCHCRTCGSLKPEIDWNTRKPMDRIIEQLKEVSYPTEEVYSEYWDTVEYLGQAVELEKAIEIVKGE